MGDQPEFDIYARSTLWQFDDAIDANPVFVHPSAKLNLPWLQTTQKVSIVSTFNGVVRSTPNSTAKGWHGYRAGLADAMRFHSADLAVKQQWAQAPIQFNRDSVTVYIGYDPATGKHFFGQIDEVLVDPQYRPDCC